MITIRNTSQAHLLVQKIPICFTHAYSTIPNSPTDPYTEKVNKARFDCIQQLTKADPSTLLISKLYPEYLRDSFIAFKSLNLELSKISFGFQPGATNKSKEFNNLKFQFWLQQLEKCKGLNNDNASSLFLDINEPCTILLADIVLKNLNFSFDMINQMVHSHQHFYNNNSSSGFRNVDEICSFGEGTHSQINYLMQSVLLSPQLTGFSTLGINLLELPNSNELRNNLTDISAHLGQATSIGSFLIGLKYFAEKKQTLMLPTDSLIKYRLPEEICLRYLQGEPLEDAQHVKELMKNVVFDIATLANDHIITARSKLNDAKDMVKQLANDNNRSDLISLLKKEKKSFPECFFLPYMSGLPTILYLERLEKHDFDVLHPKLSFKEWRLAFCVWNAERTRSL
jgi:NADH dehydrogenase [ubiquinone] 1 alpha subcomplex assembly factor 6